MEQAGNPQDGKLYLRADVEVLSAPDVDYDDSTFKTFTDTLIPARQILQMSSMYKGQTLEFKESEEYIDNKDRSEFIWKVCCAICYDSSLQQTMLCQSSFSSLLEICNMKIQEILIRLQEE